MNKVVEYVIAAKDSTGDAINSALGKVRSFASGVATNLANIKAGFDMAAGVVRNFASVFGTAIKEAFKFEKVQSDFTGLLNSVDKAKEHIADLRKFASSTPLTFDDLSKASKLLLSFGMNVDEVTPSLKMLGDIAMGDSQKFDGLALVFAQVKSAGKLMGQDLLQMINQGFNPLTVISQQTGKSMSELKDIMAEGGISFDMVAEAMKVATSEGGLFNNAMDNASKTGEGLMSTLQDKWTDVVRTFGEAFTDTAKGGLQLIDKLTQLVENGDVEVWANKIAKGLESVAEVATSCAKAINWLAEAYQSVKNFGEMVGDSVGSFVGTVASGGSLGEAWDNAGEAAQNTVNNQVLSEQSQAEEEAAIRARAKSRAASGVGTGSSYADASEDFSQSPLVQECTAAVDAVRETTVKHANSLSDMLSDAMGKSVSKADKLIQSQLKKSLSELENENSKAQAAADKASQRVQQLSKYYESDDPVAAYKADKKKQQEIQDRIDRDQERLRESQSSRLGSTSYITDELAYEMQAALEEEAAAKEYARATAEATAEAAAQLQLLNQQIAEGRAE